MTPLPLGFTNMVWLPLSGRSLAMVVALSGCRLLGRGLGWLAMYSVLKKNSSIYIMLCIKKLQHVHHEF
jgi:hypothetical protein